MTHVTEDRQTNQCLKVYFLTTILMDAVLELPSWCSIRQRHHEDVRAIIERCQLALDAPAQEIEQ